MIVNVKLGKKSIDNSPGNDQHEYLSVEFIVKYHYYSTTRSIFVIRNTYTYYFITTYYFISNFLKKQILDYFFRFIPMSVKVIVSKTTLIAFSVHVSFLAVDVSLFYQ